MPPMSPSSNQSPPPRAPLPIEEGGADRPISAENPVGLGRATEADLDEAIDQFGENEPHDETAVPLGTVVASIPVPTPIAREQGATFASTEIEELPSHVTATVEFDGTAPRAFIVTKTVTVIGRAAGAADLVLARNEEASRQHCALLYAQRSFWLEDLQSSNGTFVNDQPVTRVRLKSGDRVRIGVQVLVVKFRI